MSLLQEFKCPNCGGAITFDSSLQKMKCPYCDAEFAVSSLRRYLEDQKEPKRDDMNLEIAGDTWQEDELSGLRAYSCHSCGGEILTGENTVATSCPFCDNPVVMKNLVAGALRPSSVIPFKLDKEAAKSALRDHYAGCAVLFRHKDELTFVRFHYDAEDYMKTVDLDAMTEEKTYLYSTTEHNLKS